MADVEVTKMVLIDLTDIIPAGDAQVILRLHGDDRETIELASKVLSMGQGEFVRTAVVYAARKVISENAR
jgi:uncharacterized protein (DUF1778 family)